MSDKPVKVMAKRCDECLFGKAKLVSHERRREILDRCQRTGRTFECHKATIARRKVMCHGFFQWQINAGHFLIQVAHRLGLVQFVKEKDLHVKP